MSALGDARAEVATALEATGLQALPYMPGSFQPPMFFVTNGNPYVGEPDEPTFDPKNLRAHLEVVYLASLAQDNGIQSDDLDDGIESGIGAVIEAGWSVDQVTAVDLTLAGGRYLGAIFEVSNNIQFN